MRRVVLLALLLAACKFDEGHFGDRACNEDGDCPRPDQACIAGLCTQRTCTMKEDCGSDEFECNAGLCTAKSCTGLDGCSIGYDCVSGFCAPGCVDHDGDGAPAGASCPGVPDCADDDAERSPTFTEGPFGSANCGDQKDNDCDDKSDFDDLDCRSKCANGVDDDGDGKADFPADPGCSSITDDNERGTTLCDDGVDNDGDGNTDFRADGNGDSACATPSDTSELSGTECNDGIDNDNDGKGDFKADNSGDPGCLDAEDTSERGTMVCDDGLDNDGDTRTDYNITAGAGDPGCMSPADPDERSNAQCDDGVDNDMDGRIDVKPNGAGDPGCTDPGDMTETDATHLCDDGMDNDQDGKTDFRPDGSGDPGCDSLIDPSERGTAACDDGVDDDGDGRNDYHMTAAMSDPGCTGPDDTNEKCNGAGCPLCDNGTDDDNDGKSDFNATVGPGDPGCSAPDDNTEKCTAGAGCPQCDDNTDNEPDGTTDMGDPGCNNNPYGNNEANVNPACSDGADNDGDGKVDFGGGAGNDPGCSALADNSEHDPALVCDDGLDNDNDGKTDFNPTAGLGDAGCSSPIDNNERCSGGGCFQCDDGVDNDGDGLTDFTELGSDPGCTGPNDPNERGGNVCDDGIDNDGDGKNDFGGANADQGCSDVNDNSEHSTNQCDDGVDNDNDGRFDFQAIVANSDPACADNTGTNERCTAGAPGCPQCDDSLDNDGDGLNNFSLAVKDPGCTSPADADEHEAGLVCDNNSDDDGDGRRDYKSDGSGESCCASPSGTTEQCPCVSSMAAGSLHTCAVKTSGNVQCFGDNVNGQLGNNSTMDSTTPVTAQISGGANFGPVAQVTAGLLHTCARKTDGTAWCWGRNDKGQLGINSTADVHFATQVTTTNLPTISDIATGDKFSCAIKASDMSLWCWGDNAKGQLGDGTKTTRLVPTQVPGITALQVRAGAAFTCARTLEAGGAQKVKCWGDNASGQLGNGMSADSLSPVEVTGLGSVAQLALGANHACVRLNNNKVSCWGENGRGQLGNGDNNYADSNVTVDLPANFQVVDLQLGSEHSCARKSTNTVSCWGDNTQGQIGNGTGPGAPNDRFNTPQQVSSLSTAAGITGGSSANHTCSFTNIETNVCWGDNAQGQLGTTPPTDKTAPVNSALTCP